MVGETLPGVGVLKVQLGTLAVGDGGEGLGVQVHV